MFKLLATAGAIALATGSAQATVFTVTGTLATAAGAPAGTLSGTFTTNNALTSVTAFDLTASSFGSFAGFHYTTANASVTAQFLPQFFQLDTTVAGNELRLYFSPTLTASGGTINPTFSYEMEQSGGTRFPTGAAAPQVAAVPEPASWALMIAGFAAVGFAMRRRTRVTARVEFA